MALYIGNNEVKKIYIGTTDLVKEYLGTDEICNFSQLLLPSWFPQVDVDAMFKQHQPSYNGVICNRYYDCCWKKSDNTGYRYFRVYVTNLNGEIKITPGSSSWTYRLTYNTNAYINRHEINFNNNGGIVYTDFPTSWDDAGKNYSDIDGTYNCVIKQTINIDFTASQPAEKLNFD